MEQNPFSTAEHADSNLLGQFHEINGTGTVNTLPSWRTDQYIPSCHILSLSNCPLPMADSLPLLNLLVPPFLEATAQKFWIIPRPTCDGAWGQLGLSSETSSLSVQNSMQFCGMDSFHACLTPGPDPGRLDLCPISVYRQQSV